MNISIPSTSSVEPRPGKFHTRPIITIVGSSRHRDLISYVIDCLTENGWMVFAYGGAYLQYKMTPSLKETLDQVWDEKIQTSDAIYVVNPDDRIGESTMREINVAKKNGVKIFTMNPVELEF